MDILVHSAKTFNHMEDGDPVEMYIEGKKMKLDFHKFDSDN